jgi:hypothetical protein
VSAAGGHHAVDDAAMAEPGQCLVETWVDRQQGGGRSLLHVGPACRVGAVELGLNVDRTRAQGAGTVGFAGAQVKWAHDFNAAFAAGAVLAATMQDGSPRYAGTTLVLPFTFTPDPALRLHLNLGRDFRAHLPDTSRWGTAVEWTVVPQWDLIAERFREVGVTHWRAGARWTLLPTLSIDLSRAQGVHHARPAWWTVGVNWVFAR